VFEIKTILTRKVVKTVAGVMILRRFFQALPVFQTWF